MKTLIRFKTLLVAGVVVAVMSGCVTDGMGDKSLAGGVIGAGVGGLLGSNIGGGKGQLVAVAAGTLAGALVGSNIGESLDRADCLQASRDRVDRRTSEYCHEYHPEVYWWKPGRGLRYRLPMARWYLGNGHQHRH